MSEIKSTPLYSVVRQFIPHDVLGTEHSRPFHALERYMASFPQFDPVDPVTDHIEMTPDGFYIVVKVGSAPRSQKDALGRSPSEIQNKLLPLCLKPNEITGDLSLREARVAELVHWFARLADGNANPRWLTTHAFELAHYTAAQKGM